VNYTRFPKKDHLPDWARRDNKVTKGDRVDYCIIQFSTRIRADDSSETLVSIKQRGITFHKIEMLLFADMRNKSYLVSHRMTKENGRKASGCIS